MVRRELRVAPVVEGLRHVPYRGLPQVDGAGLRSVGLRAHGRRRRFGR